ncbi:MAG: phage portal protein [Burkholderiaceae bacterium]|nr:phage portal protein [Burkholderiaceae bacterium]
MNFIDKLVGYLDPMAGVKREAARRALEMARAYDAAKLGRRTADWVAGGGSANAEIGPALSRVRNRCRDMVRNNEYAAKALNTLVVNTVGEGIVAKMQDQALWDDWCEYCDADGQLDFNGLIELAHRTRRESGEAIIRFRSRLPEDGMAVPLQIQVLEPDHLDSSRNGPLGNGNYVITGVEFNAIGQRVAYWLFPIHPGEVATYRLNSLESKRVPASEVLHYYRKMRPSQVRGMPELGVSLLRLRDLADYEQAELVRKKIEACFVAFVRTDDTAMRIGNEAKSANGGRSVNEKVAPGMIKYISGAEDVQFGSPAASGGYGEYTGTQLHAIAAGAGVMYSQMTGDLSSVNYSSYRAGLLDFRQLIKAEQWLALKPMVLAPIGRRFQEVARLASATKKPVKRAVWTMPRLPWVDPLKDVMAAKEEHRGTTKSISETIRERGDDPDTVFAEIQSERKKLADMGILTDSDAAVSERLIDPATAADIVNQ